MRRFTFLPILLAALAISTVGCKKEQPADASVPLEQSFQETEPEVQQAIQTATTSLRAGNYAEATRALAPVVSGQPLTDQQKQAVGVALVQINQAIEADPSLDSKEMYDMRARMFRAVHGSD
jgi:outer membrane protein assembly factor BamD (BamD/ComL family)